MENNECMLELPSKEIIKKLDNNNHHYIVESSSTEYCPKDCKGYWLKDKSFGMNHIVDKDGKIHAFNGRKPALVKPIITDAKTINMILEKNNYKTIIYYGNYPQDLVDLKKSILLTHSEASIKTNRTYNNYSEFYYNGNYYVFNLNKGRFFLVKPIRWFYFGIPHSLVSEFSLYANTFYTSDNYHHINISLSYFYNEMLQEIDDETSQKINEFENKRSKIKNIGKEEDKERIKELILKNPIYGMLYKKRQIYIDNFRIDEEGKLILKK